MGDFATTLQSILRWKADDQSSRESVYSAEVVHREYVLSLCLNVIYFNIERPALPAELPKDVTLDGEVSSFIARKDHMFWKLHISGC